MQEQGWEIIVAADGRSYEFFREAAPGLKLIKFPGVSVIYAEGRGMIRRMTASIPCFLRSIRREHVFLQGLIRETGASLVISDNRYGCWNNFVKSVFITHQLNIQTPRGMGWAAPVLRKITRSFIGKYNECWIPDLEADEGISGNLSHGSELPPNVYFVGPLSRFTVGLKDPGELPCEPAEVFVLLSGPEPQRSILESMILKQLKETSHTAIIAGGRPGSGVGMFLEGRIHVFPYMAAELIKYYIEHSSTVICRSGYSTLMDLAALGKSAILIPTPGQTEQEYLAESLSVKHIHYSISQQDFRLDDAMKQLASYSGIRLHNDKEILKTRVQALYREALNFRDL